MAKEAKTETPKTDDAVINGDITASTDTPAPAVVMVKNIGLSLIVIGGGVDIIPDAEVEIAESDLETWGVQHLFANKQLEIVDDSKRTKEIIANFTGGKSKKVVAPKETGQTY